MISINYSHLDKFFLHKPTFGNSQVDVCVSKTVSNLSHDAQRRLIARECFLYGQREASKWIDGPETDCVELKHF